ncbi:uncharacterized protein ACMZJ9_008078 isoform 2-T2 [Mantella aurantiaca]
MSPGTGPLLLLLLCVGSTIISLAAAQISAGICPEDVDSPKCGVSPVVFTDECTVDQDCNQNMKCCFSGCRRRCRQPLGDKNKACPYFDDTDCRLRRPGPAECHSDDQCQCTERCCYNDCTFKCTPTVEVKPGLCPIPVTRCAGTPPPPLCLKDSDCTGNKKCCIKYCGLECVDPRPEEV